MLKNVGKFFGMAVAIGILGMIILFAVEYWQYKNSSEHQVTQNLKELEKQYAEDPYGGDTPEETLRLFIDALKLGDTELAAKYFVLDKQQQWREDLAKIKEKGLLDEMVKDLKNIKEETIEKDTARYFLVADDGQATPLVLIKFDSKWKIRTL